MTPLNCTEVGDRIELYAAGECDPAEADAVRTHLVGCPTCTATLEEAREFLALLELRAKEPERLRRLHDRIAEEARPQSARTLAFRPRRPMRSRIAAALAATVLLPLGLAGVLPIGDGPEGLGEPRLVAALDPVRTDREAVAVRAVPQAAHFNAKSELFFLNRKGLSGDEYRRELMAKAPADLPPPASIALSLKIQNTDDRPVRLRFGDPRAELRLEVHGPGIVRVPAPPEVAPALPSAAVDLKPGETHTIAVERLVEGSRWKARYLYWTEPGTYTVRARLRIPVESAVTPKGGRMVQAVSAPLAIEVLTKP